MTPSFAPSYYEFSVRRPPPERPLDGETSCDVCVIGGGFTGLSCALELATQGRSVVVLESRAVGWGASGRNGGQCLFGYSAGDLEKPARQAGVGEKQLFELSEAAVALLKRRLRDFSIACDFQPGYLLAATKPHHRRELARLADKLNEQYAHPVRLLNAPETRAIVASRQYLGGLLDDQAGHLHPLKYVLGLAAAAKAGGAQICENTAATAILKRDRRRFVKTDGGGVLCRQVVMAGNAYQGELIPRLRARIMPAGTYIGATEPLGEEAERLIRPQVCVCDMNFILDYFRCVGDSRLLFGGRVSYSNHQPPNLELLIRNRIRRVFPQISNARLEFLWGGSVAITLNRMPDLGRVDGDIYYAQGFSGHGVAMAGMAGKLIADTMMGDSEQWDMMRKIRHRPFPGGRALRMPILVLAMLYHRLRDLL